MNQMQVKTGSQKTQSLFFLTIATTMLCLLFISAAASGEDDSKLLNQFVQTKGPRCFVFDATNVKQYWIDNSVISIDNSINIFTKLMKDQYFESKPLKIQLANVNYDEVCCIEVISNTPDLSFNVLDSNSEVISESSKENVFLSYNIVSTKTQLLDIGDYSFSLVFSSKSNEKIVIKSIVFSFSNSNLSLEKTDLAKQDKLTIKTKALPDDSGLISVSGINSSIISKEKIYLSDSPVYLVAKVKNTGTSATRIRMGYATYSEDGVRLDHRNYPRGTNPVLTVLAINEEHNVITVDKEDRDWDKNCFLALNAQEDLSDIPNNTFPDGKIVDVKKTDDGHAEIALDKPINGALQVGSKVRIHGRTGSYLYTNIMVLQPGEEHLFFSKIKKDEKHLAYSKKAFSRGVEYVTPLILSYSVDSNNENVIQISEFSVFH